MYFCILCCDYYQHKIVHLRILLQYLAYWNRLTHINFTVLEDFFGLKIARYSIISITSIIDWLWFKDRYLSNNFIQCSIKAHRLVKFSCENQKLNANLRICNAIFSILSMNIDNSFISGDPLDYAMLDYRKHISENSIIKLQFSCFQANSIILKLSFLDITLWDLFCSFRNCTVLNDNNILGICIMYLIIYSYYNMAMIL